MLTSNIPSLAELPRLPVALHCNSCLDKLCQRVWSLYWMLTVENCLFQLARWYWLEISNRWMAVSCLLLWYLFIVLTCATRVSPVNLVTMYAMDWVINQKQSPQALLFLGCSQPFCLFYTLLFVLDLRQHFYHHHLHPSQVHIYGIFFSFLTFWMQMLILFP